MMRWRRKDVAGIPRGSSWCPSAFGSRVSLTALGHILIQLQSYVFSPFGLFFNATVGRARNHAQKESTVKNRHNIIAIDNQKRRVAASYY
jgi:hypothetical protein